MNKHTKEPLHSIQIVRDNLEAIDKTRAEIAKAKEAIVKTGNCQFSILSCDLCGNTTGNDPYHSIIDGTQHNL